MGESCTCSVGAESDDGESVTPTIQRFHSRRTRWHARNSYTDHALRTLGQKPQNILCRHVPLNDQTFDDTGVAGGKVTRNTKPLLHSSEIRHIVNSHEKSPGFSYALHPSEAAATTRVTADRERVRPILRDSRADGERCDCADRTTSNQRTS
jgi:hypothetical protein